MGSSMGFEVIAVDINPKKLCRIEAGPTLKCMSMLDYVTQTPMLNNVFTHHSLEHTVDAQEIIEKIGMKMSKGSFYYAAVPAEDYLHSVHHVVFEMPFELLPPYCEPILVGTRQRWDWKEYICIAQKR